MTDPVKARRAIGAMFMAIFGTAWLAGFVWMSTRERMWPIALVAILGCSLLGAALRVRHRNTPADTAPVAGADEPRRNRAFAIINVVQWVIIVGGVNVLFHVGLGRWTLPFIIMVVGVHFLPLAYLFKWPMHYLSGTALMLLAALYPFAASAGPLSPVGALGTGLILWASALFALLT